MYMILPMSGIEMKTPRVRVHGATASGDPEEILCQDSQGGELKPIGDKRMQPSTAITPSLIRLVSLTLARDSCETAASGFY